LCFDLFDPAIATGWNGFQIPRRAGIVAKHAPQLRDHAGQGVVGHRRVGPQGVENLLLGKEMARALHHQGEQVEGLGLERERDAGALEPVAVEVKDEVVPSITGGHCQQDTRAGRER
jgi:hypothetical protein